MNQKQFDSRLDAVLAAGKSARLTLAAIFDDDTFVELDTFMHGKNAVGEVPGEGVITGYGYIDGRRVYAFIQNAAVQKGGIGDGQARKILKLVQTARRAQAPLLSILDSQGARLDDGLSMLRSYASLVSVLTTNDLNGHICVVKGPVYGILAAVVRCADVVIFHENAVLATTSPLILDGKRTAAELAGAKVHATQTGYCHLTYKTDGELAEAIHSVLHRVGGCGCEDCEGEEVDRTDVTLNGSPDAAAAIAGIFDADPLVLSEGFAPEVYTAFASIGELHLGVIQTRPALVPTLSVNALQKITDFIYTASAFGLPVVVLLDSKGLTAAAKDEALLIDRYVDLLQAVASDARIVTVITGSAVGAAYMALGSMAAGIGDVLAWPQATIAPVASEAAAHLLYADEIKAANSFNKDAVTKAVATQYDAEVADVYRAAQDGLVDNVIEPALTRQYLYSLLSEG
ncbi:MAG: hypothetical protein LBM78_00450 [Clostridiales bacterium]|jgi:acetyl-CoA carboxylase carboxyltransferase component|nr:hypothetical protein [Clostridiales bacterium]